MKNRWRVTVHDEATDEAVLDVKVGRLTAVAVANECDETKVADRIMGDNRSDDMPVTA